MERAARKSGLGGAVTAADGAVESAIWVAVVTLAKLSVGVATSLTVAASCLRTTLTTTVPKLKPANAEPLRRPTITGAAADDPPGVGAEDGRGE